jgi:DNA-binding response OmpR family regulator
MDGIELAKNLREKTSTANATFIAVTGYGQETDRRKTQEAGFHYHCVKPLNMQELVATLSTLGT